MFPETVELTAAFVCLLLATVYVVPKPVLVGRILSGGLYVKYWES